MKLIKHFVDGIIISGSSDRKNKVTNPATGEQESEVRLASKFDVDKAVEVATRPIKNSSLKNIYSFDIICSSNLSFNKKFIVYIDQIRMK